MGAFSMAKKRMFSHTIVETDIFLDMPSSSQNLYFHLCMNADDDGFVSPKKIMRMCSASNDDLLVLITKRYILLFKSGVAVVKHWTVNNTIQKDRYNATTYQKEFSELTLNEWKVYTEKRSAQISLLPEFAPEASGLAPDLDVDSNTTLNSGQNDDIVANGTQMDTQYRLDKISIDKNISINTNIGDLPEKKKANKLEKIPTEELDELMGKWETIVGMNVDSLANRKACASLIREIGKDKVVQLIKGSALAMEDRYAPRISDFVSLKRKKNDLILWGRKHNTSNVEVIS